MGRGYGVRFSSSVVELDDALARRSVVVRDELVGVRFGFYRARGRFHEACVARSLQVERIAGAVLMFDARDAELFRVHLNDLGIGDFPQNDYERDRDVRSVVTRVFERVEETVSARAGHDVVMFTLTVEMNTGIHTDTSSFVILEYIESSTR